MINPCRRIIRLARRFARRCARWLARSAAIAGAATAMVVLIVPSAHPQEKVTVFAAASLTDALEAIGARHREATGRAIRFSFASSSTLARQIEAGAPAQIFASANERWMDDLEQEGLIEPGTRVSPVGNSLVLIVPADSARERVALTAGTDLTALLKPGERIAMGDPDHVPAGIYGREAMESLGMWAAAEHRLARADDVRATLALVGSGEAPLGIVYATDAAISEGVRVVGRFPAESHTPITYPFAIIAGEDTADVRAVYDALLDDDARAVFEDAGFTVR